MQVAFERNVNINERKQRMKELEKAIEMVPELEKAIEMCAEALTKRLLE